MPIQSLRQSLIGNMDSKATETRNYTHNGIVYQVETTLKHHKEIERDPGSFIKNVESSGKILEAENSDEEYFSWNNNKKAIRLLIDQYKCRSEKFRDPKLQKKMIWNEILQVFRENGYNQLTREDLDLKMRNLKKTYISIKVNNNKKRNWEYLDDFEEIFKDVKPVSRANTIQSFQQVLLVRKEPTYEPEPPSTPNILYVDVEESIEPTLLEPEPTIKVEPELEMTSSTKTFSRRRINKVLKYSASAQAVRGRNLYNFRKKHLEVEEKRLEEIAHLREAIEESNRIQRERNQILRQLVHNKYNSA